MSDDGDADAGDVGLQTLNHVSDATANFGDAGAHGPCRVEGEGDLDQPSWGQRQGQSLGHCRGGRRGG